MVALPRAGRRKRAIWSLLAAAGLLALTWEFAFAGGWIIQSRNVYTFRHADWCDSLVNHGFWANTDTSSCGTLTRSAATCGGNTTYHWHWDPPALKCGAQRVSKAQLRNMFQNRWLVVAGDSIGRFFFAALLRLLTDSDEQKIVFGHKDFEYNLQGNIRASFLWAPYASNLTAHLARWTATKTAPDFIVLSCGLWHMLHITDPIDFAITMQNLKQAAAGVTNDLPKMYMVNATFEQSSVIKPFQMYIMSHTAPKGRKAPSLSMFSITEVYPPRLKTEEKRQHLTLSSVDVYNEAIAESGILKPEGPTYLIDIHRLTRGCGPTCTMDGLHYTNTTYDAAVQIFINNLRIWQYVH